MTFVGISGREEQTIAVENTNWQQATSPASTACLILSCWTPSRAWESNLQPDWGHLQRVPGKRWIVFYSQSAFWRSVWSWYILRSIILFAPLQAHAPSWWGERWGKGQESCINTNLARGSFPRQVWSSTGARPGHPRLSRQECCRMWGKGWFAGDESCRSRAGCCVWQQRWCGAGKGRRAEREETVTTAWCRQRWKVQGHTERSHQNSACSLW